MSCVCCALYCVLCCVVYCVLCSIAHTNVAFFLSSFTINPRLQRHFVSFAVGFPGPTSLLTIYETFLMGHLQNGPKPFSEEVCEIGKHIIQGALELHQGVGQVRGERREEREEREKRGERGERRERREERGERVAVCAMCACECVVTIQTYLSITHYKHITHMNIPAPRSFISPMPPPRLPAPRPSSSARRAVGSPLLSISMIGGDERAVAAAAVVVVVVRSEEDRCADKCNDDVNRPPNVPPTARLAWKWRSAQFRDALVFGLGVASVSISRMQETAAAMEAVLLSGRGEAAGNVCDCSERAFISS